LARSRIRSLRLHLPGKGFWLDDHRNIQTTADGGDTWTTAYHCRAITGVAGVTHEQDVNRKPSPSRRTARQAMSSARALDDHASAVIKTTDGGATWTMTSSIPETNGRVGAVSFVDPVVGFCAPVAC
jgi:photosystem II stability/assembly factor-like uncharacterized protein